MKPYFTILLLAFLSVNASVASAGNEMPPLIQGIYENSVSKVKDALGSGASPNTTYGSDDRPAVIWALNENSSFEIVQLLVDAGADVNLTAHEGEPVLVVAARKYSSFLVKYFIEKHANVNASNSEGTTALMITAANGDFDLVKVLVEAGANVNTVDKDGNSALYYSCSRKEEHLEVVKYLISKGATTADKITYDGTPLVNAIKYNHIDTALALLETDTKINLKDRYGRGKTALMYAAEKSMVAVVQKLIEKGADLNITNDNHISALSFAINNLKEDSISETVSILINAHPDLSASIQINRLSGQYPVLYASLSMGFYRLAKTLIAAGADINQESSGGWVPLFALLSFQMDDIRDIQRAEMIQYLIDLGANVQNTGGSNETLLHASARANSLESAKVLIRNGVNVNAENESGTTPLMLANTDAMIQFLLDAKADVNKVNRSNLTALLYAIGRSSNSHAELLLKAGADPRIGYEESTGSALMLAVTRFNPSFQLIELLIDRGADMEYIMGDGVFTPATTALKLTIQYGNIELATLLISKGANVNNSGNGSWSPLMEACQRGRLELVKLMISKGADLRYEAWGQTALSVARKAGQSEIVDILIKAGAKS